MNLAIGQGALRASPLQVANFYATVGNGGTIYRPNLINRIVSAENSNNVVKAYPPTVVGKAPVSADTLARMQDRSRPSDGPEGHGLLCVQGSPIQVAGKTGTGQQDKKDPYAWFAGYASADKPTIAIVAVAENAGEGSAIAAPIVRSLMESYPRPPPLDRRERLGGIGRTGRS
ncbi:MAG: penicillin-binding transpeptidase domain-containing protein [Chloroflexia bacterium]